MVRGILQGCIPGIVPVPVKQIQEGYAYIRLVSSHNKARQRMRTSSNGNIFRVTVPLWGESTGHRGYPSQRPVTWSFGVFYDLCLNKRLSKQSWGWRFETPLRSLWRHYGVTGLCEGSSPVTGELPAQRASNVEKVSIWWRHHDRKK